MTVPSSSIPERLIQRIKDAHSVCVFTGAGVSAESGIPTFRSPGGLWKTFRAEDLATPEAFAARPQVVWDWYNYRRQIIRSKEPNAGHRALAMWEQRIESLTVATQNIDGLHQRAGSERVFELHGNIHRNRCHRCGARSEHTTEMDERPVPTCSCGGYLRPDVVWFGELLPGYVFQSAWNAAEECAVFFSVGTSSIVQPAASLIDAARSGGAFLVEVNPEATERSMVFDVNLRAPSGVALPAISDALGWLDLPSTQSTQSSSGAVEPNGR